MGEIRGILMNSVLRNGKMIMRQKKREERPREVLGEE